MAGTDDELQKLGRRPIYSGKEDEWNEWSFVMRNYVSLLSIQIAALLAEAEDPTSPDNKSMQPLGGRRGSARGDRGDVSRSCLGSGCLSHLSLSIYQVFVIVFAEQTCSATDQEMIARVREESVAADDQPRPRWADHTRENHDRDESE